MELSTCYPCRQHYISYKRTGVEENLTKLLLLNDILINSPVLYRNYRIKLTFDVFIIERSEVVMFNVSLLAIFLLDRYVCKPLYNIFFAVTV